MRRPKGAALALGLFVLLGSLSTPIEAEQPPQADHKWQVRVEGEVLSVVLEQAPAGEVFGAIADQGKIVIRLDRTLLAAPVTARFENLPLERGLRRLIDQLQSRNYRIDFATEAGGEPRVEQVDILAASGPREVTTFSAGGSPDQAQERAEKPYRPLNPGEQKRFEETGGLPGAPHGLQRKAERGGKIPPGNAWRFERAAKILDRDTASMIQDDQGEVPPASKGEVGGAR